MARLSKRKIAVLAFLSNHGKAGRQVVKNRFAWKPGETIKVMRSLQKVGYVEKTVSFAGFYSSYSITTNGREAIGQKALPLEDYP